MHSRAVLLVVALACIGTVSSFAAATQHSKLSSSTAIGTRKASSLHMQASTATAVKKGGDASVATSTFNLAKSIVGAGVLSLPSGIAFFSDSKTGLLPASIICTVMGIVSAYAFSLIGKACEQHNGKEIII